MIKIQRGEQVSNGLGGFIASSISGLFGGGSFNPSVSAPPTKPSFSSGGSFMVGGNAGNDRNMLSLNGAPIANVSKGETIAVKRAGSGGVTINQSINVSTGVSQTVRAEISSMLPQLRQQSVDAVRDAQSRGAL